MPTLTLKAMCSNARNVLVYDMPSRPGRLLLDVARMAAEYCRDSNAMLMNAAADGRLRFYTQNPTGVRKAYDECQLVHDAACYKLEEIESLIESEFDDSTVL